MKRIADYEIDREIGHGSQGTFYLAQAPARLGLDGEPVALKVLDHNATDQEFRRVANELKMFRSIESPFLVDVYDAGYQGGRLFYAMRYYPEGTLADPKVSIDRSTTLQIVADAARGAHALHEGGVVHRDIKPANILIEAGRGRLSDLGLAQVMTPGMTTTGSGPVGSIEYLEPDVIWGERASRSTDVWSLGVTLHRALTGESVYQGLPEKRMAAAFQHVLHSTPELSADLEPAERAVIERCLAEQRSDRWPTAEALAEAIESLDT
jgi:serine/threonine protein kinase